MKLQLAVYALVSGGLTACSLAPPYHEPTTETPPPAYKETGDWQQARPADDEPRGPWWQVFHDSQLDSLEQQVTSVNQNLRAAFARLQQARAEVRFTRASYFPTVTATAGAARQRTSINAPQYSKVKDPTQNNLLLESDVSYEIDVFGRVRNTVAAARDTAQASAADLATLDLSLHAELAMDYFTLRGADEHIALLDQTVVAYQRALELTDLPDGSHRRHTARRPHGR
jgi:outer membrane protein, multidrug efflux system